MFPYLYHALGKEDKPVKELTEAPALSPDTCSVHYHPFFPVTV